MNDEGDEMIEKRYSKINEVVYSEKLKNGLIVKIIPKKGYRKFFVSFGTKYGSLTNKFVPNGENEYIEVPLGIAHFLEHKMFAMEDGSDAANEFAQMGLDANAYTDYLETVYLFSGTTNLQEGIELLLDFVQKPYFTDENIQSEQGIIEQELLMYLDMPGDRLHIGLMDNMFQVYPLKYDVGGTVKSIKKINKELLYKCYNTFYHPSNMTMIVVGDVNPRKIVEIIKNNQSKKEFLPIVDIKRSFLVEDNKVFKKYSEIKMDIVNSKVAIGIKLPYEENNLNDSLIKELLLKIILEIKLGPSSDFYQKLIDEELVTNGVSYSVFLDDKCGYIKVCADSNNVQKYRQLMKEYLLSLCNLDITEEEFARFKKAILGSLLKSLNSEDFIASSFLEYDFKNCDFYSSIELLEKIDINDLKKMGKYFTIDALCEFVINPR